MEPKESRGTTLPTHGTTEKPNINNETSTRVGNWSTPASTTALVNATQEIYPEVTSGQMFTYVIIPIGAVIFTLLIIAVVIFMLKKNRLDKLRHHLMPLYNFDPAEEGEDWETELLEEGMDHRTGSRVKQPGIKDEPKLAFRGDLGL